MRAKDSFPKRRAVGAGLVGLLLLAGCHKEPKGQVIAIVNGNEISAKQLDAEVKDIPIPDTMDLKLLRKTILQGLIDREVQVEEAREQGLDKTPEYLALKRRNEEELLASMLGQKVAQTVPLPVESEIRNYIDANPLQFAKRQRLIFDELAFAPPKDRRKLSVLANTHTLEEAAAALQSIGIVAERGEGTIDTGQADPQVALQLLRAPAGEPILLPQGDHLVVGVIVRREPMQVPPDIARMAAARAIRGATLLRESEAQIAAARSTAEISYEPGYEPDKAPKKKR